MRQRNVQVQVVSADPINKVFKGIYADSNYENRLTSDKTYGFTLVESENKELYFRYSQKPVKIIFKKPVYGAAYKVTGTFGEIEVDSFYSGGSFESIVEFPTDTTPTITIGFTTIASVNSADLNFEVGDITDIKINDVSVSVPYSVTNVTPGSTITVEVIMETVLATTTTTPIPEVITTTTTTTTTTTPIPAVLKLQSNAENTVVEVTSDGIDPVEVSLAGTSKSRIEIDMNGAPEA